MKFKIKYADQIVGLFILVALGLFLAVIILVGANQRWFSRDYRFKAVFASAAGVPAGTSILMKGFVVGKIERIRLNDKNLVDADFHIFDTYRELVREYSILELAVSPIGLGTQLLFHPGRGERLLEEGEYLPLADSPAGQALIEQELVDIPPKDDTITRLISGVGPLLDSLNRLTVTLNRTLTEVNRALAGQSSGPLGDIVNEAAATVARFPVTMNRVDGVVAEVQAQASGILDQVASLLLSIQQLAGDAGTITANLAVTSESLKDPTGLVPKLLDPKGSLKTILDDDNALYKELMAIVDDVGKSVASLQGIVGGLNSEMPKISAMLNETRTAIQQAQDVLEGVKNNPLIRGGVPERAVQESLYGSMREGSFN